MQGQTRGIRGTHASDKPSYGNSIKHATIFEGTHTHAQDQPSCKPMVTIYCSGCDHGKELDMHMFWHKINGTNRFQKISCISCKKSSRLGKWLRRPQEADNSIEEWLTYNNAIAKDTDRLAYMTVELYLTQNTKEERALKRNAPHDAPTTTAKQQKKTRSVNAKSRSLSLT